MAKRKTKKAEEVIDLTPKAEKINEQQLAKLQSTIKSMDQFTNDIGRMEIQKQGLVKAMDRLSNDINKMRMDFSREYGTDDINIHDGTINYQENGEVNQED
jgi:hypothetical protein